MILRGVKGRTLPFGGIHVLATGDPGQLSPCDGRSVFGSLQMLTTFAPLHLDYPVRSAGDDDLMRLIRIIHPAGFCDQGSVLSDDQVEEFVTTFRRRCEGNICLSPEDLDEGIVMIVGKKKAEEELEREFIERKKFSCDDWREFLSSDFVDNEGTWIPAAENVSAALNRKVLMKQRLFLFPGARVRLTENGSISGQTFSQGQSGVVRSFLDVDGSVKIQVSLVPSGQIFEECEVESLPLISVGKSSSSDVWLSWRSRLAKREQFPLKLDVAATCHKILGSTLARLAFKLGDEKSAYGLWDRRQLLVIISRVRNLSHIYPVGAWADIEKQIRALLVKESKEEKRLCEFLRNLDVLRDNPRRVVERFTETLDLADVLPVPGIPCAYMIVNAHDPRVFWVGETLNLRRRYNEHRTSNVLAMVYDFGSLNLCGRSNMDDWYKCKKCCEYSTLALFSVHWMSGRGKNIVRDMLRGGLLNGKEFRTVLLELGFLLKMSIRLVMLLGMFTLQMERRCYYSQKCGDSSEGFEKAVDYGHFLKAGITVVAILLVRTPAVCAMCGRIT
ncbi:unnamed protein product [Cyprideis torosa]|uniref:Uncharacterized protein n=1 Tax=Cyprideis torosa TaxID=163714 RepID=A0A7R8WPR3_9CRUS|nr:unnamed protein product [Cyprideis torosa]CAG0905939.1 unnamed protein product [Cyprideis torosa]